MYGEGEHADPGFALVQSISAKKLVFNYQLTMMA